MIGESQRRSASVYGRVSDRELFRQAIPAARGAARDDFRPPRRIRADVAEAAPKDAYELQPELLRQLADFALLLVDEIAAGLGVLAVREPVAERPDPPADAVARVDDDDVRAQRGEVARRREPREPRAGDQHRDAPQRVHAHHSKCKRAPHTVKLYACFLSWPCLP